MNPPPEVLTAVPAGTWPWIVGGLVAAVVALAGALVLQWRQYNKVMEARTRDARQHEQEARTTAAGVIAEGEQSEVARLRSSVHELEAALMIVRAEKDAQAAAFQTATAEWGETNVALVREVTAKVHEFTAILTALMPTLRGGTQPNGRQS